MFFVPYVPSPPPASPKAQELAGRLRETIDRYKQEQPSVSPLEIRQALTLASASSGNTAAVKVAVVAAFGVAVLGAMVAYFLASGASGSAMRPVILVTLMVVIGLAVLVKSRSGSA